MVKYLHSLLDGEKQKDTRKEFLDAYSEYISQVPFELRHVTESIILQVSSEEIIRALDDLYTKSPEKINQIVGFCQSTFLLMSAVFDKGDGEIFGTVAGHHSVDLNASTGTYNYSIIGEIIDSGRIDLMHALISRGRDFKIPDLTKYLENKNSKFSGKWIDHLDQEKFHIHVIRDSTRTGVMECIHILYEYTKNKESVIWKSKMFLNSSLDIAASLYLIWHRQLSCESIFEIPGIHYFIEVLGNTNEDITLNVIQHRFCPDVPVCDIVNRAREIAQIFVV